jgi:hypothetical protein
VSGGRDNAPERQALVGFHAVAARLESAPESIELLYVDPQRHDARMRRLCDQAEAAGVRVMHADARRLAALAGPVPHPMPARCCCCSMASPIPAISAPACVLPMRPVRLPSSFRATARRP